MDIDDGAYHDQVIEPTRVTLWWLVTSVQEEGKWITLKGKNYVAFN